MKLLKSYSEKEIKRIMPLVSKINSLEDEMKELSDEELSKRQMSIEKDIKMEKL